MEEKWAVMRRDRGVDFKDMKEAALASPYGVVWVDHYPQS